MYDVSGVDLPHPVSLFGIQHEHDAMIDPWTREFFLSGSGYRQIPLIEIDPYNVIGHRAGHVTNQRDIFINFNYKYATKTSKTSGFSSSARGPYLACHQSNSIRSNKKHSSGCESI